MALTEEQLLAEIDDLLRTRPPRAAFDQGLAESHAWLGRAGALIAEANPIRTLEAQMVLSSVVSPNGARSSHAMQELLVMLNQSRYALFLKVGRPLATAIGHGSVFEYFDELRKLIEPAIREVFFVDPYLDAEFVPKYLPHVKQGVVIRLLTSDQKLATLLPSVDAFAQQYKVTIAVRTTTGLHDRLLFVDGSACYQSGASFKDGAKKAPTTLAQLIDAFGPVLKTYEEIWTRAAVHR
jgi:hypothetical protein